MPPELRWPVVTPRTARMFRVELDLEFADAVRAGEAAPTASGVRPFWWTPERRERGA